MAETFLVDTATIWNREWLRFVRRPARVLMAIVTPLVWMAMFGYGLQRGFSGGASGSAIKVPGYDSYLDFSAPGIIAMGMLFSSIFSGMSIIFERQFGFLKEILVAPVRRISFVMGKALGGMTTALVQGAMLLIVATLVFGLHFTSRFGFVAAFGLCLVLMAMLGVSLVNLGIAIAAKVQSHEVFFLISNFLVMPMFFLSGALYPTRTLPAWFQAIIALDPLRYGVDGLRWAIKGTSELPIAVDVGALLVFTLLTSTLAATLFEKS
jgi:ABC-2 type transport system permease protein